MFFFALIDITKWALFDISKKKSCYKVDYKRPKKGKKNRKSEKFLPLWAMPFKER